MPRTTLDLGTTVDRETILRAPFELLTSVQTIVANRGRGKSWLARTWSEQAADAGYHFAVIDPTGVWWGITSSDVGGSAGGLDVIIFGGNEGHLPLLPESGKRIAQFLVESRQHIVLDTSSMRKGKTHQFMADFLEELFALKSRKQHRTPLHLFWDETEQSAPQKGGADQMRVLGAAEDCTKLGRSRGFGMTLITQRPATLNKNLLDLSDTIHMMGITSPRDKKAVLDFLADDMDKDQITLIRESLASLPQGEFWTWSPRFGFFERCRALAIRTYDSMRTPEPGERMKPVEKRAVDLNQLAAELEQYVEQAKSHDPKELKRAIAERDKRIRELEKAAGEAKTQSVGGEEIRELVEVEVKQAVEARDEEWRKVAAGLIERVRGDRLKVHGLAEKIAGICEETFVPDCPMETPLAMPGPKRRLQPTKAALKQRRKKLPQKLPSAPAVPHVVASVDLDGITGPQQRILDALAWWEAIGVAQPKREAVAAVARYKPTSGGFNNPLGSLRTQGMIQYPQARLVQLTDAGRALAHQPDEPPTLDELHDTALSVLKGPQRRILTVLLEANGETLPRTEVAERAGYEPTSGGFNNPLGHLRTIGFVEYPASGEVRAADILFPAELV